MFDWINCNVKEQLHKLGFHIFTVIIVLHSKWKQSENGILILEVDGVVIQSGFCWWLRSKSHSHYKIFKLFMNLRELIIMDFEE